MGQWKTFQLTAPGKPPNNPGSDMAAVSREPGHLEVFHITPDGAIWSYFWYGSWNNFQLRPPGTAIMGGIAAVSRRPESMILYYVTRSGSIESGRWEKDWGQWRFDLQIAPPGSAALHTKLVALRRQSENLEIIWMGPNGSIECNTWTGSGWQRTQVAPDNSAVIMFSGLTAVSRRPEAIDVTWVSPAGSVENAWRWGLGAWTRYQIAPNGSAAVEGATLQAHARLQDTMNMWWVSPRGSVEGVYCIVDKIPWSRYQIAGDGSANTNGCIFSLHRFWLTEEIWWITKDGAIMDAYWYEGMGPWGQFQLAPPGTAKPYGSIYGNSRDLGIMDIFFERMDGNIQSFWYEFRRKDFGGSIPSGGLAALGGWTNVSLFDDGFMRWNGDGHDSGADDYDYAVVGYCRPRAGSSSTLAPIINVHQGHVEGHFIGGSGRDDPWDQVLAVDIMRSHWDDYANGTFELNTQYSSSFATTFEKLLNAGLKWTVGTMLEGAGVFILVGATVYSLVTTGDATAGARIANGILYMAGPLNTFLAFVAEGIATVGSRSRYISADEYKWANDQVFKGTLPPADKILITDTKGKDGRAFVWPLSDGRISMNVGGKPGMYENPRDARYDHTFIHELTHTWQIHHTPFELGLLVNAFANQLKGSSAYQYGPAGPSFKDGFNLEQQASIVEHWWLKSRDAGSEQVNDPYYRYIRDNIRAGQYF